MDALRVVAEPRRREILRLVWDEERTAGDIASQFEVTFGAISQHLAVLRGAGLVRTRRAGNRIYYWADRDRLGPLRAVLEAMWAGVLDHLAETIERDRHEEDAP
ncbi:MAG TPA: metalloregulator ArsR/SmtB family transcription factor [Dehalococcoidia bacterium]|nr:metalloregulator ArsR/SmtB family transcription factor [Dehalococcoidia bacterium]